MLFTWTLSLHEVWIPEKLRLANRWLASKALPGTCPYCVFLLCVYFYIYLYTQVPLSVRTWERASKTNLLSLSHAEIKKASSTEISMTKVSFAAVVCVYLMGTDIYSKWKPLSSKYHRGWVVSKALTFPFLLQTHSNPNPQPLDRHCTCKKPKEEKRKWKGTYRYAARTARCLNMVTFPVRSC